MHSLQHSSLVSKQPPLAYYYTVHTKFSYVERREGAKLACRRSLLLCTEVRFTSFPSGEFTTGPSQGLKIRGGLVVLGGDNVPPLVEIGLTDLTKTGGAKAPLAPPLATALTWIPLFSDIRILGYHE